MNNKRFRVQTIDGTVANHGAIVAALANYRRTWQETAAGQNLVEVTAPVGLVIADVAASLGLDGRERLCVLGEDLNAAVSAFLAEPVYLKQ